MLYYDFRSTDPNHYDVAEVSLPVPPCNMCNLVVTSLTTQSHFVVLDESDYIQLIVWKDEEVRPRRLVVNGEYNTMDKRRLKDVLLPTLKTQIDNDINIEFVGDNSKLLKISSVCKLQIIDASYHFKLLMGMYDMTFPIDIAAGGSVVMKSLPCYNLTPIFYLVSNLSTTSFSAGGTTQIVMRIVNTYRPGDIITETNGDYMCSIPSTSMGHLRFQLKDANLKDIKLITPMYISITVEMQQEPSFELSPEEH